MTRVGFATGYDPRMNVLQMARWVQRAEEQGYELSVFSETIALMRDSVTALSVFSSLTSRVRLATIQVVRLRTPVIMAQTAASLDELSGGRVTLVLGACTRNHAERHSLEHLDPVSTLTEWAGAIREILANSPASYKGEVVRLNDVAFGWNPVRPRIPIWIAATSKTGLRLAAQIGDGVLLNSVASPEYSANAIRIIRDALAEAGRDWESFEVAQIINCSVEDERSAALQAMRWEVASKFDPVQGPFNVGPRLRVGEPHIREDDLGTFAEAHRKGGKDGLMAAVPDHYVANLTASGTPAEARERVQQYRDAGVKLPVLRPGAEHQIQRVLDLFAPNG